LMNWCLSKTSSQRMHSISILYRSILFPSQSYSINPISNSIPPRLREVLVQNDNQQGYSEGPPGSRPRGLAHTVQHSPIFASEQETQPHDSRWAGSTCSPIQVVVHIYQAPPSSPTSQPAPCLEMRRDYP
jgi:hypothetical protein